MRIFEDSVKNVKSYEDKTSPKYINYNSFKLQTVIANNNDPYLVFYIQYAGDDWLFIKSYFFKVFEQNIIC